MTAKIMTNEELARIFSENKPVAEVKLTEVDIAALADDHEAACYEDEGEAAYGRDE